MKTSTNIAFREQSITGWKLGAVFMSLLMLVVIIGGFSLQQYASNMAVLVFGIGVLIILLIPTISGLIQGLPRWAIPSVGFILGILSIIIFSSWINFLPPLPYTSSIFGKLVRLMIGRFILFGHMLLLSILLVLVAVCLPRLHPFLADLKRDWSILSFLIFGSMLPTILLVSFDAYQGETPYQIVGLLILAAGVWGYLHFAQSRTRLYALMVAVVVTMVLFGVLPHFK